MLEILILYTLHICNNSIYGIKKELENKFSHLMTFSFGSLHPVLKKLEKLKVINVKKEISEGGKRKFTYTINAKGKSYFEELMLDELPTNPLSGFQCIKVKLMTASLLSDKLKVKMLDGISRYYELAKIEIKNKLINEDGDFCEYEKLILVNELSFLDERLKYITELEKKLNV